MLVELELMTVEELKGKVAVIRTTPEGHRATMMEINAFQARHPEMQKTFSFLVLVGGESPIRDVHDVAAELVGKGKGKPSKGVRAAAAVADALAAGGNTFENNTAQGRDTRFDMKEGGDDGKVSAP